MSTLAQTSTPTAPEDQDSDAPLVSVVIPCLNEAENIESCVTAALEAIKGMGVSGEVVVADNDSEDDSARLAEQAGARVVVERRRGYGSAYLAGFAASRGELHRDGRRRPDLRLPGDPPLRGGARRTARRW